MDISNYKVEDFVLDPEFRKWVLSSSQESLISWHNILEKYPKQHKEMHLAREIVLNLSGINCKMDESESMELWDSIDKQTPEVFFDEPKGVLIPLNSWVSFYSTPQGIHRRKKVPQIINVAAILVFAFAIAIVVSVISETKTPDFVEEVLVEYDEFQTPHGVKSTLTLNDGSRIILNSGSSIKYVKNFNQDKRMVHLTGEAYFEVAKDPNRPFSVVTGNVMTTALGTSFNVTSYKNEPLSIALLTGKISVDIDKESSINKPIFLEEDSDNSVKIEDGVVSKEKLDVEKSIAWTQKTIVFEKTKLEEAIRVLENWYGVNFYFHNNPNKSLTLSGKFQDETLKNVLEGLSYSARFDFDIKKDKVEIRFKQ